MTMPATRSIQPPRIDERLALAFRAGVLLFLLLPASARADDIAGVRSVAFSPDGKMLAVTTGEPKQQGTVALWDVATGKRIWKHTENDGIPAVAFAPDGQTLSIAVYDGAAKILGIADGGVKATLKHPKEVRGVAFSPDGKLLATVCWDTLVRVWDVAAGAEKVRCMGHQDRIYGVGFSPDGKRLLSAGAKDGAKLWDAATGKEERTFKHYYIPCARFSPDGQWVLTCSYDGTTRVWNVETGEQRAHFSGGGVQQLAFSEPAHTLAVCGFGRDVSLFDLTLHEPDDEVLERIRSLLTKLDDDSYDVRERTSKELLTVGFLAEGELRKAAGEAKSVEVCIRARRVRQELLSKPKATLRGHTDAVEGLAFSPDGKLLATGGKDGTVRLWEMATLKETARWAAAE